MKLVIGAEKGGEILKEEIIAYLLENNYQAEDAGANLAESDDLIEYIEAVVYGVINHGKDEVLGIIISSDPIVLMAANRFKGIRAGVAWDVGVAKELRSVNDANVLCLPLKLTERNSQLWQDIIEAFINTKFGSSDCSRRRNARMDELLWQK